MIWSKTKKAIESLLADSVRPHVKFHMTRYGPGVSYTMSRAWITWDGAQIAQMSNAEWLIETHTLVCELTDSSRAAKFQEARHIMDQRGRLSRDQFESAVDEYLTLSIEDALKSDNPIVLALAMFDRRLGKRRLKNLLLDSSVHPLVKQFYDLRCKAEGFPEQV